MDSDAEVAAARLGRVIGGRFRLERVLGIGGMAAVYQARDAQGGVFALKLLHPEMAGRREVRERFVREGAVANKIGHAGVVQTFPSGEGSDDAFLVMEMLSGETLRARVKRHGRLPLEEVLDYAEQILDVLVAAHQNGVVHRDLKPDNLFVSADGRVKVLDFGLARVLDDVPGQQRTRTGVALGTLAYMAPEQALGRRAEIDGRVDIFALGATMFRVLSGRRVHEAESEAELLMAMASRPAPPLASVAQGLPDAVGAVVDLALAFSRDARYPDAVTMLVDVKALRAGLPPPYATSRFAARDEATRADGPAPSLHTQPLEAAAPSQRGGTVPLAAYKPGAAAAADTAPMSARPGAVRTEPLAQQPLPSGAPQPLASAAPAPGAARAAGPVRRRPVGLIVAVGALAMAIGGGGAVWLMLPGRPAAAPPPLPAPEPAAAPPPRAEGVRPVAAPAKEAAPRVEALPLASSEPAVAAIAAPAKPSPLGGKKLAADAPASPPTPSAAGTPAAPAAPAAPTLTEPATAAPAPPLVLPPPPVVAPPPTSSSAPPKHFGPRARPARSAAPP